MEDEEKFEFKQLLTGRTETESKETGTGKFVYRGSPVGSGDFTTSDFTTDGTEYTLDLSAIVPEEAIAVLLYMTVVDGSANNVFTVEKTGGSGVPDIVMRSLSGSQPSEKQAVVGLDDARTVTYAATNTVWSAIVINIIGWFI